MSTKRFLFLTATVICFTQPSVMPQERAKPQQNATAPFVGSWRIDVRRTGTAAVALSYEQRGDTIRATTPQGSYTFKIDGNEYPTAAKGETMIWKYIGSNTDRDDEQTQRQDRYDRYPALLARSKERSRFSQGAPRYSTDADGEDGTPS
jgi:hypothetical protein